MRSISGARNRVVLIIFGILALAAATWLGFAYFGLAARWPQLGSLLADGDSTVGGIAADHRVWLLPAAAVASVLAVIIGIALLVTQVPAQTPTSRLRLTDADGTLLATLDPDVLGRALSEHAEQVPGILDADVRVTGAASSIWLQSAITVAEDAEVAWSIEQVRQRLADDVTDAVGRGPRQVDVLVHLRSKGTGSQAVAQSVAPRRSGEQLDPVPQAAAVQGSGT
ncbi:hypothetical protein HJ590_14055 [Naumannella sp. ID2617S]|nr:hypothetical protein [Naumannella sp. ID2617S]